MSYERQKIEGRLEPAARAVVGNPAYRGAEIEALASIVAELDEHDDRIEARRLAARVFQALQRAWLDARPFTMTDPVPCGGASQWSGCSRSGKWTFAGDTKPALCKQHAARRRERAMYEALAEAYGVAHLNEYSTPAVELTREAAAKLGLELPADIAA